MRDLRASTLVGKKPAGAVRTVSLAVKSYLDEFGPEAVVVGVSGGADSLALAVATIDLATRKSIPTLAVVIDHGLRPESRQEAQGVANLLQRLGADQVVIAAPAKMRPCPDLCRPEGQVAEGQGPEGEARVRRHRELRSQAEAFARRCGTDGADLLLGHTMDDQAETVLLGLSRGSGLRSLRGMARRTPVGQTALNVGRPLLWIRRADTEAFCQHLGLPIVQDPTNKPGSQWRTHSGETLRRAAVRAWALPELARSLGQDPVPALARTAKHMREDNEALDYMAEQWLQDADAHIGIISGGQTVAVGGLVDVPAAVRRRIWRALALSAGALPGELMDRHLRDVDRLAVDWRGRGPVQLPGGVQVARRGPRLHFQAGNAVGE